MRVIVCSDNDGMLRGDGACSVSFISVDTRNFIIGHPSLFHLHIFLAQSHEDGFYIARLGAATSIGLHLRSMTFATRASELHCPNFMAGWNKLSICSPRCSFLLRWHLHVGIVEIDKSEQTAYCVRMPHSYGQIRAAQLTYSCRTSKFVRRQKKMVCQEVNPGLNTGFMTTLLHCPIKKRMKCAFSGTEAYIFRNGSSKCQLL